MAFDNVLEEIAQQSKQSREPEKPVAFDNVLEEIAQQSKQSGEQKKEKPETKTGLRSKSAEKFFNIHF